MPTAAPLQVLLFSHPDDVDLRPFEEAILRAFQGGKEVGGYLASGEDLGIQLAPLASAPALPAPEVLDGFCHTLVVILIDRAFLVQSNNLLWDWIASCHAHIGLTGQRHAMVVLSMEERLGDEFSRKHSGLAHVQVRAVYSLGERALRPAMLALLCLHECRLALGRALHSTPAFGMPPGHLRLFISHAKIDGLPLAHALRHLISSIGWLRSFYDADDLPAGCDWQMELERGVGSSLIIMLRTDIYDSRYWCQQEVRWADEYATPAVLVDARTALSYAAGVLPFDRTPTVRIPDGNLLRVLFLALREGLRFLHFVRLVEEMKSSGQLPRSAEMRVFSYAPSTSALLRACRLLSASSAPPGSLRLILYPDPPLRTGPFEAATTLVAAYAPGTHLVTPQTLAATMGGTP